MEKVFTSFKNLYTGEDIGARHWALISLFIFPALLSCVTSFLDKDTPQNILIIAGIVSIVLLVLSIVPGLWLLGFIVRFAEDRLMGKVGLPKVDFDMLMEGCKVFPLALVWGIYFLVITVSVIALPFLPLIGASENNMAGAVILMLLGLCVAFIVLIAFFVLVVPFYNYIFFEYIKYGHQGYLYNPASLSKFMKVAFMDTIAVFAKFLLVSFVVSFPMALIQGIAISIIAFVGIASAVGSKGAASVYTPMTIIVAVVLGFIVGLLQIYVTTMISYAATENYVEVYKTVICPDDEDKDEVYLTHEI